MQPMAIEVELCNSHDVVAARRELLSSDGVRRLKCSATVDTSANRLLLPKSVVSQLGLMATGQAAVRFIAGRRVELPMYCGVQLTILGRTSQFTAVLDPASERILVGKFVLYELDLIVDHASGRIGPRDPNRILAEIE